MPRQMVERGDERLVLGDRADRATNRSSASRASTIGCPRMLSLMSSSTPRLTGARLSVNCVIGCSIAVLENLEVVLGEAGDQAVVGCR